MCVMLARFGKAVLALAAFAVLFATVCPLAPTPTAVAKVKPAPVAVNAIALALPAVALIAAAFGPPELPVHYAADVLSITCVRTC